MKRFLRSVWPWSARAAAPAPVTTPAASTREDSEIDERIETWLSGSFGRPATG